MTNASMLCHLLALGRLKTWNLRFPLGTGCLASCRATTGYNLHIDCTTPHISCCRGTLHHHAILRAQGEGRVNAGWVRGNKTIQPNATPPETLCHARTGGRARQGRLGEGQQDNPANRHTP